MLRTIVALVIGYVLAAPLSSHISMDLTQTDWMSAWTYIVWLCSFGIWFVILMLFFGIIVPSILSVFR